VRVKVRGTVEKGEGREKKKRRGSTLWTPSPGVAFVALRVRVRE